MHWIPEIHIFYVDKSLRKVIVVWSSCCCSAIVWMTRVYGCEQLGKLPNSLAPLAVRWRAKRRTFFQRIQTIRIQSTPLNAILQKNISPKKPRRIPLKNVLLMVSFLFTHWRLHTVIFCRYSVSVEIHFSILMMIRGAFYVIFEHKNKYSIWKSFLFLFGNIFFQLHDSRE